MTIYQVTAEKVAEFLANEGRKGDSKNQRDDSATSSLYAYLNTLPNEVTDEDKASFFAFISEKPKVDITNPDELGKYSPSSVGGVVIFSLIRYYDTHPQGTLPKCTEWFDRNFNLCDGMP